jgi:hypothetical protein
MGGRVVPSTDRTSLSNTGVGRLANVPTLQRAAPRRCCGAATERNPRRRLAVLVVSADSNMPTGLVEEEGGRRRERAIDLWGLNSRLSRMDLNVAGALADAGATSVGAGATIRGRSRRCCGGCCCDSTSCEKQCDETRFDRHFFCSLVDESVAVMMPSFVHPVPPNSGWWVARVAREYVATTCDCLRSPR